MKMLASCVAVLALGSQLHAGFVHVWVIGEIDDSLALVVATVEGVAIKERAPTGRPHSNPSDRYWEATLRVHRAFSTRPLRKDATITVRYISYGNPGASVMPILPHFEKGYTALFPLKSGDNGQWGLVADEGFNLTVPAILSSPQTEQPSSGRGFIISELANTLANGTAAERYDAAVYLREAHAWPDGLREVLDQDMGAIDDRWLEVACALLASLGLPQPTVDQLMANPNFQGTGNQAAAWALEKGAKRDYPNRLIRCFLRNMHAYEWGAANRLLEFKDSPLLVRELTASLASDPGGSIYVAYTLIRNGQRAFITEALNAAVKMASNPGPIPMNRLHSCSSLLRDYGSDEQFDIIPAALRRLKNVDEDQYRKLIGSVNDRQSKRELRVAAILIDDRRPGFGSIRYCDLAAAAVEKLSGENFGIKQEMTASDWDRAVALAATWLASHRNTI